jgi:hypothetical protein
MVDEMKPTQPVTPRSRWPFTRRRIIAQVIVAAVILASGIGIGAGGTVLALKDRLIRFPPRGDRPRPPDPNGPIDRWRGELGLTDEQAQQIKDMFTKQLAAARDRWLSIEKQAQIERDEFVASMKSILTPEQFEKWEQEFRERERHFRGWRPGGPRGDRRGPDGPNRPDGHRRGGPRSMRPPGPPPEPPPE